MYYGGEEVEQVAISEKGRDWKDGLAGRGEK